MSPVYVSRGHTPHDEYSRQRQTKGIWQYRLTQSHASLLTRIPGNYSGRDEAVRCKVSLSRIGFREGVVAFAVTGASRGSLSASGVPASSSGSAASGGSGGKSGDVLAKRP